MEFRILGPLEVHARDRPLALGGVRQRMLLASLLLNVNEVLSSDRLIEELWGEERLENASKALQVAVTRLRRTLEPSRSAGEASGLLVTRPPGYQLCLERGQLDLHRFEDDLDASRAAFASGDPAGAVRTLTRALALWRGPPLADLAHEGFARAEIARLEELRSAAVEERIGAELELGRHVALVGELQELVDRNPLRERLREQLMLALYRCGRQADALAAYRECRRTLNAELGIEPGAALRQLEADVLRQAPSLDSPTGSSSAARGRFGGRASLSHRDGNGNLHVFVLEESAAPITVGRQSSAQIWVSWDTGVSRRHGELRWDGGDWRLADAGSANGSYVNGERLRGGCALKDGDEVRFGDTVMTFRSPLHAADVETRLADAGVD